MIKNKPIIIQPLNTYCVFDNNTLLTTIKNYSTDVYYIG